ncbi:hypothetical protein D3C73_1155570 [compost metagenome]
MMKDSTVINKLPSSVTIHKGILCQKPTSSIAWAIAFGRAAAVAEPKPERAIMVEMMPCTIVNSVIISSRPYVTTAFASTKRMNSLTATSGFFTSAKLPVVFTTPMTKNKTSSASPVACRPP